MCGSCYAALADLMLDVSLDESGELIPSALLSDAAAAAECVTVTYAEKYLKKIGEGQ